jgi:DNA adenine methylase
VLALRGGGMKPPFTYFGGKTSIAPQIAALLPAHEHYVEPFAGSLAVLLAKKPSRMETVNDLDGDIVAFWRVLRDRPGDLERVCALTPHSRAEHAAAYERTADDLEQARRVWVKLTQGRGGTLQRTGWRFSETFANHGGHKVGGIRATVARIAPAAVRIADVSLECRPAIEVIAAYGRHPDVLIYADPPYLGSTRAGGRYQHEMTSSDDHGELLSALLDCRAGVVLSGYASPLYDSTLEGWHRREIGTQTGNGTGERSRTEVLWSNRPFPQGSLFDADLTALEASG